MLLTQSSLARWDAAHLAAETDRTTRVKVFTMSGAQIGKAGIGESDEIDIFEAVFGEGCSCWNQMDSVCNKRRDDE